MADRLRRIAAVVLLCGVSLCPAPTALSQTRTPTPLRDPTRPPAGVFESTDSGELAGEKAGGRVLQSVLIPRHGKPMAVIDGQTVRLGQRFGEARLIQVSEHEAVLDGPQGVERLQLTPGIEKANIRPANVTTGAKRAPARPQARNEG